MKISVLIFIVIFFSYSKVLSQDIIYPEIEKELNEEQKKVFDNAFLLLQKASGNENNADAIDWKYRKKRNSPKWELKIWEAKEQRILAERNYQKAYSMLSKIYSSVIENSIYKNDEEKSEALLLNKSAKEQFSVAKEILSKHKDLSKIAMANTKYELLMEDVKKSHELHLNGISDQITALEIKRIGIEGEVQENDLAAWEKAKSANTMAAYHEYLNNNPRGKYMSEANDKIRVLERKMNDVADNKTTTNNPRRNLGKKSNENYNSNEKNVNETSSNNIKNNETEANYTNPINTKTSSEYAKLIFKVQIAASKTVLSDWILSHKAPNADLIEEYRTSSWVKYMVGKFNTYQEAAEFRDKISNTAPDAFIVVFEKGKQIAVTEQMKM